MISHDNSPTKWNPAAFTTRIGIGAAAFIVFAIGVTYAWTIRLAGGWIVRVGDTGNDSSNKLRLRQNADIAWFGIEIENAQASQFMEQAFDLIPVSVEQLSCLLLPVP